jgi:hypothetical protein
LDATCEPTFIEWTTEERNSIKRMWTYGKNSDESVSQPSKKLPRIKNLGEHPRGNFRVITHCL